MRRALFAIVLLGCSSGTSGPTTNVLLLAGEIPVEPGATVISHTLEGDVLDQQVTDGAGRAQLQYQTGALVTAVFHRSAGYRVITTPALATGDLAIHGPPPDQAPILSNNLVITAVPIDADAITVDMGCTTAQVTSFPKTLDVPAQCLGSDPNLDVLVRATIGDAVVGYFAARVPSDQDGVGMLDIPAWSTDLTTIPVTQNDLGATLELDEVADVFVFTTPRATDHANAWTGLVADSSHVRAQVGIPIAAQTTTRFGAGVPASIVFGVEDFLPAATTTVALRDRATLSFGWTALAAGDLTNLHATWAPADAQIDWDVVLAPDADHIVFPALDPDLASTLAPPVGDITLTTDLRAIDGPDTTDFASVQAAGLWLLTTAGATIVPPPTTGEIRETNVGGFD
ncbi:MAG TPA: hypothetical protein VFQ65_28315 [Kofleriaceae bacterium]|nr:hypothetical protein [Kofleriaceae bacterium]